MIHREGSFGVPGSRRHAVAAGAAASIKAGELVLKSLGDASVVVWTASNTAKPVAATDYIAGISASTSTDTAAAVGYVDIIPNVPGLVFLGNPKVAGTWDTQAEYDALVNERVTFQLDTTTFSVDENASGTTYGLVIVPSDIRKYPGKVAFEVRRSVLEKN